MNLAGTIAWWPFAAASLHITEEFVFPGGFAEWDRSYRQNIETSITPRFHVIINGLLLFACAAVGTSGLSSRGVAGWLTLAALLAANTIFHIVGTIRTRRYSPGLITGLLLYFPLAIYGYPHFLSTGQASTGTAIAAFVVGASYQFWSTGLHRLRAHAPTK